MLNTESTYSVLTSDKKQLPHLVSKTKIDWRFLSSLKFEDDYHYHNVTGKRRLHSPIGKVLIQKRYGCNSRPFYIPKWNDIEINPRVAKIINSVCPDWDIAAVYKYSENDIEVSHRVSYPYPSIRHIVSNVDVNLITCLKKYYVKKNHSIKVLGDALHSINSFSNVPRLTLCVWNSMKR